MNNSTKVRPFITPTWYRIFVFATAIVAIGTVVGAVAAFVVGITVAPRGLLAMTVALGALAVVNLSALISFHRRGMIASEPKPASWLVVAVGFCGLTVAWFVFFRLIT